MGTHGTIKHNTSLQATSTLAALITLRSVPLPPPTAVRPPHRTQNEACCVLKNAAVLRIASEITSIRRTQHGIATSDIVSRAVDGFRAAQLPAYVDGTLVIATHKSVSWLFPYQSLAPWIPPNTQSISQKTSSSQGKNDAH